MKGFTLIELLVVIGILGILSVVLLVTINPVAQIQKANDARRKSDLEAIQHALELYYQDAGSYPPSSSSYTIEYNNVSVNWGSSWQPYIATLPKDPVSTNQYVYYSPPTSNGPKGIVPPFNFFFFRTTSSSATSAPVTNAI